MRIACIGDYSVRYSYFTAGVMEGAIRLGHWFRPIALRQVISEIINQVEYFQPDIIFAHQIIDSSLLAFFENQRSRGVKIAIHEGDPKSEPRHKSRISRYFDIGLINSSLTEVFSNMWEIPCYHWPYFCLQQSSIETPQERFKAAVSFSGNITSRGDNSHVHYGRAEFLGKIIGLKVYPNEEIKNSRFLTPIIAASSDTIIGVHQGWDIPGYLDTRPFQYIGAGALYFHDRCEAIEQYFHDGVHYVGYERKNLDSFFEQYNYYVIDHHDEGQRIRQTGFNYCQKEHNAMIRIKQAIEWLKI